MTKKARQKLKYLENEKSFLDKIKNIFIIFKRLSVAINYLRAESASLMTEDKILENTYLPFQTQRNKHWQKIFNLFKLVN